MIRYRSATTDVVCVCACVGAHRGEWCSGGAEEAGKSGGIPRDSVPRSRHSEKSGSGKPEQGMFVVTQRIFNHSSLSDPQSCFQFITPYH